MSGLAGTSSAAQVHRGDFDLREEEVIEEERAQEDGDDDSPSPQREVRVLNLPSGWMEKEPDSIVGRRRQWEVVSILPSRLTTRPQ